MNFSDFFGGGGFGGGGFGGGGRARQEEPVDTDKFYNILGVGKSATSAEIKKAYRKKAMRMHPDKGGDEEQFKELTKAYECLSDEQKRKLYDKYGEKGLEQGGGGGGGGDFFSQMFGGGGRDPDRGPRKGKDVMLKLPVTLEDMYNGASRKIRMTRSRVCNSCDGKGGSKVSTCGACRGRGIRVVVRQVGPGMVQQMQMECDECAGKGENCDPRFRCKVCVGQKVLKKKTTLEVFINKGMRSGSKLTFRGESDEAPDVRPGDVIVVLDEKENDRFTRKGAHLFFKKKITLLQSLTGFQFTMTHMDGRVLVVNSEPNSVVKPGDIRALREEGMPIENDPFTRGNLYIEFEVVFPDQMDEKAFKSLRNVLGDGAPSVSAAEERAAEPVTLDVVQDMAAEKRRWAQEKRGGSQYDEDDSDEDGGGGGGQQCRAQ